MPIKCPISQELFPFNFICNKSDVSLMQCVSPIFVLLVLSQIILPCKGKTSYNSECLLQQAQEEDGPGSQFDSTGRCATATRRRCAAATP
jgi:hypothetical protein